MQARTVVSHAGHALWVIDGRLVLLPDMYEGNNMH